MRLILWLSSVSSLLAVVLAVVVLLHVPLSKHSTVDAVAGIEKYVVNRDQLTPDRLRLLDKSVSTIRENDKVLRRVHQDLQRVGLWGFLLLSAFNFAIAARAFLTLRQENKATDRDGQH